MYILLNVPSHVCYQLKQSANNRGCSAADLGGLIIEQYLKGGLVRPVLHQSPQGAIASHASCPDLPSYYPAGAKLSPCSRGAFVRRRRAGTTGPEPSPHYRSCLGVTLLSPCL